MLDIVIVNWNSGTLLKRAVLSVGAAEARVRAGRPSSASVQVVVVDNASSDRSLEEMTSAIRGLNLPVDVVRNEANLGFAAACNQGAQRGHGDFILFLNPDTALQPNALQEALAFFADPANRPVGICGIQLRDEDGRPSASCSRFPTVANYLAQAVGLDRFAPFRHLGPRMSEWDHASTQVVEQVMGAFLMIRRTVFAQLGGFDERFFMYFEEVDLSWRARQAGWQSVFLASAWSTHTGGGSSRAVKAQRLAYSLRSRLLYFAKHFGAMGVASMWVITFLVELPARLLLASVRRSKREFSDTTRGYALALASFLPGTRKG